MPLFFTGDTVSGLDVFYVIPLDSAVGFYGALQTALSLLTDPRNWEQDGAVTVSQAAQVCSAMFKDQFLLPDPVGSIFPTASNGSTFGNSALVCDGASYATTAYPALFGVIGYAFGGAGANFNVPDLRAKFPVGAGGSIHGVSAPVGAAGGEQSHTLTVAEMPSHSHTDVGHTHVEGTAAPTAITIGPGAPAPAAVPAIGTTGSGNANLTNTGGAGAHENMPPWLAINYFIVTGLPQ